MNKKWMILGGLVVVVLVAAGAVWYLFFKDDAPDAVDNTAANEQLDEDLATTVAPDSTAPTDSADTTAPTTPAFDGSIDGVWVIDDEIGQFDFDTASGSFAGFRVDEELAVVGDTVAVGRSGDVTGTVTIADGMLTAAEVTVDMTAIVSNEPRRESAIQRAVNADEFPTATFAFAGAVDVSAIEVGGDALPFTLEGDLTVNGVTRPVTFAIEANVREDGFGVITGSTEIVFADFDVDTPSAAVVVSLADEGIVEFQLVVAKG